MVHAKRIAIFIGLILLSTSGFAQSFELVRPADFRYYVTVGSDTVSSRSLDYKAFQDAVHQKCEYPESTVTVHPIGVEVRGCPEPTVYIPYAVYEDLIRTVNWEHRQSVPDIHVINLEVDHQADSLITWIEACNQMWQSGEEIACNEMAYLYAEGIKGDRTVIVRDSVDLEAFNDFFLTTIEDTMAFSGIYASTSVPAPDSDLTDFSFLIDLSTLPQSWWDEVDTSDPTKGRAAKDDGTTEQAADWIEFDEVAETGWVRVKWSGTNPSTGGQTVRIYPPKTANDSYLATDTFGQYNAYDSNWAGYWADGGETDRTSNQNNGTATGTPTDVAGKIGSAKQYRDTAGDDPTYYTLGDNSTLDLTGSITLVSLVNGTTPDPLFFTTFGVSKRNEGDFQYHLRQWRTSGNPISLLVSGGSISSSLSYDWNDTTAFVGVSLDSGTGAHFRLNGATEDVASTNAISSVPAPPRIAETGDEDKPWIGWQDDVQIHSVARGEDWLAYEYAQSNDNATFWGTWTVEGGGGGGETISPNSLTQSQVLSSPGVSVAYTLSPNTLTQSQLLTSPDVSVAYTLSPNGIIQGQVLSSPDVDVNYSVSPDGLLQGQQLSQPGVSVAYTVTPDTLTQIQSLSTPNVNTGIIITPAGLTQSQSLASPTIDPVYVLSPETLTQGQQLSQAELDTFYEIVANSITQSQQLSIPDVNVGFFITPDNLTQAQSLDQADIEPVYIFTPDQLTQSQELSDVILGIIGKATKFNTTVEPLYDISTTTEKLYAISTTTKKLYIIETTIKPIIDG